MKFDWRKMVVSNVIPGRPGLQRIDHLVDVPRDIERVAPRELLHDQQQARAVLDDGVADERLVIDLDVGDLTEAHPSAVLVVDGDPGEVAGVTIGNTCRIPIR